MARFDNLGTNLIYLTYLGGNADDVVYALAVDGSGNAFVAGTTDSTNFPHTNAIISGSYNGYNGSSISGKFDSNFGYFPYDAFVAELDPSGSNLVYSTYLGGERTDAAFALALDPAGNAFVTGETYSTNFPVSANAFQKHLACTNNYYINANAFRGGSQPRRDKSELFNLSGRNQL